MFSKELKKKIMKYFNKVIDIGQQLLKANKIKENEAYRILE